MSQDSPFFNYLTTLSPIKPVKSGHRTQGFSELSFPPPTPVSTSPRINTQKEASFCKRPQFSQSLNAKLSQHDDSGKMVAAASDIYSISLMEFDDKCSIQVQPCSPSRCIDEYLADPVDTEDGVKSIDLANLCMKQSNEVPEALECSSSLKENIIEVHDNINTKEGSDTGCVAASQTSLEQAEGEVPEKLLFLDNPDESEAELQKDRGRLPAEYQGVICEKTIAHMESESSIKYDSVTQNEDHVVVQIAEEFSPIISIEKEHEDAGFDNREMSNCSSNPCQHRLEVKLQNAEGGQQDEWDCTPQLLPESLQISQAYQDHDKKSGVISRSVERRMQCDFEDAGQHQRGMLRRSLQFEVAEGCRSIVGSSCSQNPTNRIPGTRTDFEDPNSCSLGPSAASSPKQPPNLSQSATSGLSLCLVKNSETCVDEVEKSVRDCGNAPVSAPLPSGIGLHLNSIVNSSPMVTGVTASMKLEEKAYVSVQGQKSLCILNHQLPEDLMSSSLPLGMIGMFSSSTDDGRQEIQTTHVANSDTSQSPDNKETVKNYQQLKLMERHSAPSHKRKSASKSADIFEELNQPSPKKGRQKVLYNNENKGCKRCNCKRSKCLKLYCECFAAGVYCAEPCACQECFNKPEYEYTVLGTRQQIESRNPLAFAPKIVQRVSESPANSGEDGNRTTPLSVRHKRGCNCKRSLCLKKYCECYQFGVGCSEACRCEGCKNVYGVKEELLYRKAGDERWERLSNQKLDMLEMRTGISNPEHSLPHGLSPPTPSSNCSDHGKNVPELWVPARRCIPSPDSDSTALSSYDKSPKSPSNANNHERQQKSSNEVLDIVLHDQNLDCIKAGRVDQFLPRWDGLADFCNLSPLPHPPSRATACLDSSDTSDCTKVSRAPVCHGIGHSSSVGSLCWCGSPITPMHQLGARKLFSQPDSDNGLYDFLGDDTPEILKDTATPMNTVKASSPNKKRVSPPHSRLHELRSSSSSALRSGRKFILQAVPSFPPLTPDSDPKSGTGDK
ncbi:hypothetical protein NE237_016157 [Protea cynaroides]|uniref:CRC domain-containing protein n=1 Tax=Protea cynaroides TaxID=273540 RepID=A0A9Q0KFP5_9MAGN|nr:hypothetical protein NE237_016157 [Protea cynaroides]